MARSDELVGGEDAHLKLEGIDTPIHTLVTRRSERGMTVEQPLPFLQLRTMVQDQTQRPARIESVSMLVCDGMPRLILDLAYEPQEAPQAAAEPARETPARMMRQRPEETQSFETPTQTALSFDESLEDAEPPAAAAGRESTLVFDTVPPPAGEPRLDGDPSIDDIVEEMQADRLGPRLARGWARVEPHLRHAAVLVGAFVVGSARRAYPHLRRAAAAIREAAARGIESARQSRAARAAQADQD